MRRMNFVGKRLALFKLEDVKKHRTEKGIDNSQSGLTGWARVNGRDELSTSMKVDLEYIKSQSFGFDLYLLWLAF